jgi:predicted DNA-binding transcriptional regulator
MNATFRRGEQAVHRDLAQVLEPLVGYICAAERPKETLHCVLAVLRREVQEINRTAGNHMTRPCAPSLAVL